MLKQVTSADVGGSTTMPLTFFQGLAVPLQCVGCIQSPVYSEIPKSCFACIFCSSLLQAVCDTSSCWSFTGLEREGVRFLFWVFCPLQKNQH